MGGAAVNGVIGGVTGAAEGFKRGMNSGSHSTPAAALAFGALGVAGLVEWPVLLAVSGGALLLQRLNRKEQQPEPRAVKANLKSVPAESAPARKAPAKTAAKKAPGRRAGAGDLRSTN
ncbi:putative transmembrane protein [Mycobacterium lepraemurium]|nr:putative transmembrane protein [Mycobacterium lepraemurium]